MRTLRNTFPGSVKTSKEQEEVPTIITLENAIYHSHNEDLSALCSIISHPRSLARPLASWRPPTYSLPALEDLPGNQHAMGLTAAISRYRVGPHIHTQLAQEGHGTAAYAVTLRFSTSTGQLPNNQLAQAWLSCLVGLKNTHCVHEFNDGSAITYVWIVDGNFRPMYSPIELFQREARSAA